MEDAHSAVLGLPDVSDNISWFAVFDGHAGSRVSAHCSGHLLDCILSQDSFKESLKKEHVLSEEELMDKVRTSSIPGLIFGHFSAKSTQLDLAVFEFFWNLA